MPNGNIVGVGVMLLLVVARICLDGVVRDDPTDIAMKRAGIYGYVMTGACCFFGLILAWLMYEQRNMKRQRAELRRLNEMLAQMEAEDRERRRRSSLRSNRQ